MINSTRQMLALVRLAVVLKRHGGLAALKEIPLFPPLLYRFLRVVTFLIPTRFRTAPTTGERLANALAQMGPAYIKVGQTLATRPDVVGRPIAEGLTTLQDRLPPFDFKDVRAVITEEHGKPLEDLFSGFEEKAIAAASIAQVHRATTSDGSDVAVKVLRPGVRRRFARDIRLFQWLADIGERHLSEARRLKMRDVVAKIRETTEREMDLRLEAAAAQELAENMATQPDYHVPGIDWDRTSERMMVLEWIDGIPLNRREALVEAGHDLSALATRIISIFLRQALHDGYFHADLHQGNLIVRPDGTLAAVDFGIMGRLSRAESRYLAEILYGFIRKDYRRVAELHFEAGYVPPGEDIDAFAQALRSIADPIIDLPVEEISAAKLLGQLFATTERFKMQTRPELLLLQRSMVMAEGLALHLNPQSNLWITARPVLEDWLRTYMSPEIRLADALRRLPDLISRAPGIIDRLLEPAPGPANPPAGDSMPRFDEPPMPYARPHPIWPLLAGAAITAAVFALV